MDDKEIYAAAVKEWTGVIATLWDAFGKELDTQRLKLYKDNLAGVPLGLLERAVARVIREHEYNNVPTLGEVWGAVKKELKLDGIYCEVGGVDAGIQQWRDRQSNGIFFGRDKEWVQL